MLCQGEQRLIFVIAAVYVEVLTPTPAGGWTVAHMPMTLYLVLIVAGLAAAIIGWLLERRKGSAGS